MPGQGALDRVVEHTRNFRQEAERRRFNDLAQQAQRLERLAARRGSAFSPVRFQNLYSNLRRALQNYGNRADDGLLDAWDPVVAKPRAARRTLVPFTCGASGPDTQIWSRRRPLSALDQSFAR